MKSRKQLVTLPSRTHEMDIPTSGEPPVVCAILDEFLYDIRQCVFTVDMDSVGHRISKNGLLTNNDKERLRVAYAAKKTELEVKNAR